MKAAVKKAVASGALKQVKGVGATDSFKLPEKPKAVKTVNLPAAAKPKKAARSVAEKAVKKTACCQEGS